MTDIETQRLVEDHVRAIEAMALSGDEFAVKTLACMALLIDAPDDPGDGGETILDLAQWRTRLAA